MGRRCEQTTALVARAGGAPGNPATDVTDYVLDGQSAVRTLLNGVVDQTFLHGLRGPEYQRVAGNDPVWYLYDGLGSVHGTVSPNGTIISTRKYDVYGSVRASTGPSGSRHKFVGALGHPSEDDTGLLYMRARYMDPVTGRFVSEDPSRSGANWLNYCSGNPVDLADATGCWAFGMTETQWRWYLNTLSSMGTNLIVTGGALIAASLLALVLSRPLPAIAAVAAGLVCALSIAMIVTGCNMLRLSFFLEGMSEEESEQWSLQNGAHESRHSLDTGYVMDHTPERAPYLGFLMR